MVDKFILKQILKNSRVEIEQYKIIYRDIQTDGFNCYIFVGVRSAGKSFLLYKKIQQLLSEGCTPSTDTTTTTILGRVREIPTSR